MKTTTTFLTVISILFFLNYPLLAQTQKGDIITGGGVYFGLERSVAISDSGNRIIAGAAFTDVNGNTSAGVALVFELVNNNWQQLGDDLEGENESERFGRATEIAPSGDRVAVGGDEKVKVYDWTNNQWEQIGGDITVPEISGVGNLEFSANGEILGVGYTGFNVDKTVRVYKLINNIWTELGDGFDASQFGAFSLSNDGERIVVQYTTGNLGFELKTHDFSGGTWTVVATTLGSATGEVLTEGFAISASGNRLIATTRIDDMPNGYVTTYDYQGNDWVASLPELPIVIDNNFGMTLRSSNSGNIFILGTADDNPIVGVSDIFVYQVINNQWQLAGDVINGSADDEAANGHVDITGDGQNIVFAGNETPSGGEEEFVAGFDMSGVLSVTDQPTFESPRLYPNPTSGKIEIDFGAFYAEMGLTVQNILGQTLQQKTFKNSQNIHHFIKGETGVYFVTLTTPSNNVITFKVLKN